MLSNETPFVYCIHYLEMTGDRATEALALEHYRGHLPSKLTSNCYPNHVAQAHDELQVVGLHGTDSNVVLSD